MITISNHATLCFCAARLDPCLNLVLLIWICLDLFGIEFLKPICCATMAAWIYVTVTLTSKKLLHFILFFFTKSKPKTINIAIKDLDILLEVLEESYTDAHVIQSDGPLSSQRCFDVFPFSGL